MKRADYVHRFLAKAIDLLVAGILCSISWVGALGGAFYIAISDGFFKGQSLGKKLIGLRVLVTGGAEATRNSAFRDSIIRNIILSLLIAPLRIPFLNIVFFLFLLLYIAVEAYFVYFDDRGVRIGDIFAGTQVIDEISDEDKA